MDMASLSSISYLIHSPLIGPFAIFDPVSLLVIHFGISKLAAMTICASVIVVVTITASRVFNHIRNARIRNRDAVRSKMVKATAVNGDELVAVIDMNSQGKLLHAQTFQGEQLDPELAEMSRVTILNHV